MFDIRDVAVSLGFFGALYCVLSLLVVGAWHGCHRLRRKSAFAPPGMLFALRIFPLLASVLVTVFLAFPAFFLLESNSIDEDLGTLVFSICGLLIVGAAIARVWSARTNASRVIAEWTRGAGLFDAGVGVPALQIKNGVPLVLVGIFRPKVLVSCNAVSMLSKEELRLAMRHEVRHLRARDNLKKLLLHAVVFPGMAGLEAAWRETAELAADNAAVSNRREAIELAGLLVKMSELGPQKPLPAITTGLVNVPALIAVRVERLLAWNGSELGRFRHHLYCACASALVALAFVGFHYREAILLTHRFTEWFIH